ncbi:hypothetical protein RTBOTA2_006685 [Rhodotorula toruloides]|nr:hypothetical protein RTBOTA2_006685 [Rhodotorula toruloides]
MPTVPDESSPPAFTVASLVAAAKAARLPPPTVETLLHKLSLARATVYQLPFWSLSNHDEFVDAAHPAANGAETGFPSVVSLPSLGAILSRAGYNAILALVGDAKKRCLCDFKRKERAGLDAALKAFFSCEPEYFQASEGVSRFWGVCKAVAPKLPERPWKPGEYCDRFISLVSSDSSAAEHGSSTVWLARGIEAGPAFAAVKDITAIDGTARVHDCSPDDDWRTRAFAGVEQAIVDDVAGRRNVPVVLHDTTSFLPVFLLDLKESAMTLRNRIDKYALSEQTDACESVSLQSLGVDPQDVSKLVPRSAASPRRDYALVYGTKAPLSASLESAQQNLLHILALFAHDNPDDLGKQVQAELLRLLRPPCIVRDPVIPPLSSAMSPSRLFSRQRCRDRALATGSDDPRSSPSSSALPIDFSSTRDICLMTVAPADYRLVTFDELEKGCAFTAAFVQHDGELVGFHRFPSCAPLRTPPLVHDPSLPPTPPPTPPPGDIENEPPRDDLAPEPLLLLSGTRFGKGNQGYVYRAHPSSSPFPLLAKYSYDGQAYRLMKAEAAFYRENHVKLEEEQLAPKFVGSWKTTGGDSPLRYGSSAIMILVEEWGQALAADTSAHSELEAWKLVNGDKDMQQHMKELALRLHLVLNYSHESLGGRNIVWKPEVGPSSLRLIDFARTRPHNCRPMTRCCYESTSLKQDVSAFMGRRAEARQGKEVELAVMQTGQELEKKAEQTVAGGVC